jgi:hypothetical protein
MSPQRLHEGDDAAWIMQQPHKENYRLVTDISGHTAGEIGLLLEQSVEPSLFILRFANDATPVACTPDQVEHVNA